LSQRAVLKDSTVNLLGYGLPLLAAIFCIPVLLAELGTERFGVLTLLWAVVSYAGLLDLGLGKVLTQQLAALEAEGRSDRRAPVVASAMLLLVGVSLALCLLVGLVALLMADRVRPLSWGRDALWAGVLLMSSVPAVVLSNGFRGILEADRRFMAVNAVRLPMGLWTFVAPVVVCWISGPSLALIALVLSVGRWLALWAFMAAVGGCASPKGWWSHHETLLMRNLAKSGGWMTVSSLLSAFMGYLDRFVLAFLASPAAVAYYAVPHEVVTKLWILPTSIVSATFPRLVKSGAAQQGLGTELRRSALLVLLLVVPVCALLGLGAEPILRSWVGASFALQAAPVLAVLCAGMVFGAVAAVPFNALHALGLQEQAAKVHCWEFPFFVGLIVVLVDQFGALGAAWAWTLRCVIDCGLMSWCCAGALRARRF
jgi:O-antigen/teichoic acid export membrane protein